MLLNDEWITQILVIQLHENVKFIQRILMISNTNINVTSLNHFQINASHNKRGPNHSISLSGTVGTKALFLLILLSDVLFLHICTAEKYSAVFEQLALAYKVRAKLL